MLNIDLDFESVEDIAGLGKADHCLAILGGQTALGNAEAALGRVTIIVPKGLSRLFGKRITSLKFYMQALFSN